jgi:hypothetical protein
MPSQKSKKAVLVIFVVVAIMGGIIFLVCWADSPVGKHPEFGTIYTAMMSEAYVDRPRTIWQKAEATIRQWLDPAMRPGLPRHGLQLGSTLLGWSLHSNSPGSRDGWIYLREMMPRSTGGNPPLWEVALSPKPRLADVSSADLNTEFYGLNDPRGANVFGTNWNGSALVVPEGQVLIARLATNHSVVYVIRLAKQGGTPNWGSMKIEYVAVTNRPPR